jgi:hypothetical protein
MSFARSERGTQLQQTNHQQDHWPSILKIQVPPLGFVQQEQHAYRDDDRGACQPSNRAALAPASSLCAHLPLLLTPTADPIPQHQKPDSDQHYWPENLAHPEEIEHSKIVQKKQRSQAN